jgi:hypothetical protein
MRPDRQCQIEATQTLFNDRVQPILLKNSLAAAPSGVVTKIDPLERAQSDANESGDGLRRPKLPHEKREASFSTE